MVPFVLLCVPVGCSGEPDDDTSVETDLEVPTTAETATPTGETGVRPFQLTLEPVHDWSVDATDAWPQHHATVAWTPQRELAVAWTLREVYTDPTNWLRLVARDGTDLGVLELAAGDRVAKPDIGISAEGHAVIAMELDGIGIGVEVVDLPSLVSLDSKLVGFPSESEGNNSSDLAMADDDAAIVAWYSGDAGFPGQYYVGGMGPSLGDRVVPLLVASIDHLLPQPVDVARLPAGQAAVAWADIEASSRTALPAPPDATRIMVSRVDPQLGLVSTAQVYEAIPGPLAPPRPALATNEAGQGVVAWRTEPAAAMFQLELAMIDLDGTLLVDPFPPVGPDTDRATLEFAGESAVILMYERPSDVPSIWLTVLSVPSAETLLAPVQVTDPSSNGSRPSLAVRETGPGAFDVGLVWEWLDGGTRRVAGRMATLTRP